MKKRTYFDFKKDLWVLILDILAVNVSYYLAILFRYYLRSRIIPGATGFLSIFWRFAPYYTVICIVVFLLFRLYNGMWLYAGINDLNRIVLASLTASILHVAGTAIFIWKMPNSYYIIGAAIQVGLLMVIRYSYRIFDLERRKISSRDLPVQNVMVVGADMAAKKVLKYLESENGFKPVVVLDDKTREKSLHGLPVVKTAQEAFDNFTINQILVADPLLSDARRDELRKACEDRQIEMSDFTGFFSNQSGVLPLTNLVRVISSPAKIRIGDKVYDSPEKAMQELRGRCTVTKIEGEGLTIDVKPDQTSMPYDEWAKQYKQETGEDVSFF